LNSCGKRSWDSPKNPSRNHLMLRTSPTYELHVEMNCSFGDQCIQKQHQEKLSGTEKDFTFFHGKKNLILSESNGTYFCSMSLSASELAHALKTPYTITYTEGDSITITLKQLPPDESIP
jgi:hypothetical protein